MARFRPPRWIGYVAASLMMGHALLSYYWALGGMLGMGLLTEGIQELAEDRTPWFIGIVWGVAILKSGLALLAVTLTREWQIPLPRWMPMLIIWAAGAVMAIYALLQFAGLTIGGFILNAGEERSRAFWAYLLLWMPLWLAIGLAFLLTAWWATSNRRESAS